MIFHKCLSPPGRRSWAAALGLAWLAGGAEIAPAASINYGNFGPVAPGMIFQNVTESTATDPLPLFGQPNVFAMTLAFDPTSFAATANGGSSDLTDGQLTLTARGNVNSPEVVAFDSISASGFGDFTLIGVGGAATGVQVGAVAIATVTHIDGIAVAPINLTPNNDSEAFNLQDNGGAAQPWSVNLTVDVAGQLAALQTPFVVGATGVNLSVDVTLAAVSEAGSAAFISQKDFQLVFDAHAGSTLPLLGDFNGSGGIEVADYVILSTNLLTNVTALTTQQAYLLGDVTGDLRIDGRDFVSFRTAFDVANGVGAFVAMLNAIPEPTGWLLAWGASPAMALAIARRRRRTGGRRHFARE